MRLFLGFEVTLGQDIVPLKYIEYSIAQYHSKIPICPMLSLLKAEYMALVGSTSP